MTARGQSADIRRLLELEEELAQLKAAAGEEVRRPLWVKAGDYLIAHARTPVRISRKKYLTLALTCGWFTGAHRWYAGEKGWAVLYLLTSWTGIAAAMTIVDIFLLFARYEPDEEGMVVI